MSVATHCFTSPTCHDRIRFLSRKSINGTFLLKILPPSQNAHLKTTLRSSRPLSAGFRSRISKVISTNQPINQSIRLHEDCFDYVMPNHVQGVIDIVALTSRNALKELSTPLLLKLVGVLACAFLIVPSADAVDALKTCACLLKECR